MRQEDTSYFDGARLVRVIEITCLVPISQGVINIICCDTAIAISWVKTHAGLSIIYRHPVSNLLIATVKAIHLPALGYNGGFKC